MGRISLSGSEKSIEEIWSWYEDQKEALREFRNKLVASITLATVDVNPKFHSLSLEEIDVYFEDSEKELDHLVCFDLVSATEGLLRSDFYRKVFDKDKSDLGRIFRKIHKKSDNKISLEEDIIENWKKISPSAKSCMSKFLGLLHYRHWLAHERYWIPKFGQRYTADNVYGIVDKVTLEIQKKRN